MSCIKYKILQALIDEELDDPERERISRHTEVCPSCKNRLAAMRAAAERVRSRLACLDPEVIPSFPSEPTAKKTREKPSRWRFFWRPVPVPAGVLLLIFILFGAAVAGLLFRGRSSPHNPAPEPPVRSIMTITAGGRTQQMAVDFQFRDYRPVTDPKIIVFTEETHEKSAI